MADQRVVNEFSSASSSYTENAAVQKQCAQDLLEMLNWPAPRDPERILEIGCGSGLFTTMLAGLFPNSRILACDPSEAMLAEARKSAPMFHVEYAAADAENTPEGSWDLIVSNAALQWAGEPSSTLAHLKSRLGKGGMLAFAYFTKNTYPELATALSHASGLNIRLPSAEFGSAGDVRSALIDHFDHFDFAVNTYRISFETLPDLFRHVKRTGTRGSGAKPKINWTKGFMEKTEREYRARFGGIYASYEAVICAAK